MNLNKMNISDMRIERNRYTSLVLYNLKRSRYNTEFHKSVKNIIYFTILLSFTLWWLALPTKQADSSVNIHNILNTYFDGIELEYLLYIMMILLSTIIIISLYISIKNIRMQIVVADSLILEFRQNEIFNAFIKEQLNLKNICKSDEFKEILTILTKESTPDLVFSGNELEKFIEKKLSACKFKSTLGFYSHYTRLILLNQCIDGVLVEKNDLEYILIINENFLII